MALRAQVQGAATTAMPMTDEYRNDETYPLEPAPPPGEQERPVSPEPPGFEAPHHPEAEQAPYHPELDQAPGADDSTDTGPGTVAEEVEGHRVFFGLLRKAVTFAIVAVPLSFFLLRIGWGAVGDGYFNEHVDERPARLDETVRDRYRARFVMDWHADSLLWSRDLHERDDSGHWDFPRAVDGGIDLQMLTIVSASPEPLWLLALAQEWPLQTLWDPAERVDHQLQRARSAMNQVNRGRQRGVGPPPVEIITDGEGLVRVAQGRAQGIILGLEGIHGIDEQPDTLDEWYRRGVRMASIVHRMDNTYGSSAVDSNLSGADALTPAGREILERMRGLQMILDVSHAAPGVIDEALDIYRNGPVVASHTGLQAHCDIDRNLSSAHASRIAENGGLIGIMFAPFTLCGDTIDDLVEAITVAVDLVGEDHVALGSDWDGYVPAVVEASEIPELMAALEASGMSPDVVRKVVGENSLRFLQRWLR